VTDVLFLPCALGAGGRGGLWPTKNVNQVAWLIGKAEVEQSGGREIQSSPWHGSIAGNTEPSLAHAAGGNPAALRHRYSILAC